MGILTKVRKVISYFCDERCGAYMCCSAAATPDRDPSTFELHERRASEERRVTGRTSPRFSPDSFSPTLAAKPPTSLKRQGVAGGSIPVRRHNILTECEYAVDLDIWSYINHEANSARLAAVHCPASSAGAARMHTARAPACRAQPQARSESSITSAVAGSTPAWAKMRR